MRDEGKGLRGGGFYKDEGRLRRGEGKGGGEGEGGKSGEGGEEREEGRGMRDFRGMRGD
jgi:hypothetical protein